MVLQFERWEDGRWFIVLPLTDGLIQDDLEMVCGADTLLDCINNGSDIVSIAVATENTPNLSKEGWDAHCNLIEHDEFGGTYTICTDNANDIPLDNHFWLCNVTHNIFGEHPNEIYFKIVESYERKETCAKMD